MILADTSAWIEFFARSRTPVAGALEAALRREVIVVGDLVAVELLQGIRNDRHRAEIGEVIGRCRQETLCGPTLAPIAAENYRSLRRRGVIVRGTIDVIIATWCIENDAQIIHNDRDLRAMEDALGLRVYPIAS
ncbi:type II toxin-antitoxin system VapC family toxin [Consotaella aegiceratis]|uniref:type II toxin-antitoxin system VapC family toxin n=1 Tax=Consotaella aegiceratis TaxID=3097961 RepID=UPI002F419F40